MRAVFIALVVLLAVEAPCCWGEKRSVKIGFIAPLSGPFADWGESIKRGVELGLEDSELAIVVDFQDDRCEPMQAMSAAQKFFDVERISYVLGPGCDHCLLAIASLAERKGAILFSTGLLAEDVFSKHANVINLATQISTEAGRLARQMVKDQVQQLAIVHGTNTFGEEYAAQLAQVLHGQGIKTNAEALALGTTDFRAVLLRMLKKGPDAFFIHQGEQEIIAFVRQLRTLKKSMPIYSEYGFETQSIRDAGPAMEGVVYSYPLNSSETSPDKERFDKRFYERYGASALPSATSYYAYDGVMFLSKAIQKCGDGDSACVRSFFTALGSQEGISGKMRFREDGGLDREYGMKRLQDGSFVWISQ